MDMANDEEVRDRMRDQMWTGQVLPRFREAGMADVHVDAAMRMFNAGFETGWECHKGFLVKNFIAETQRRKVHLA